MCLFKKKIIKPQKMKLVISNSFYSPVTQKLAGQVFFLLNSKLLTS